MGEIRDIESIFLILSLVGCSLVVTILVLFYVFNQRKKNLLQKQKLEKQQFQRELVESEIEIRKETLRQISWELHDNIGQQITLAKMYLQNDSPKSSKLNEGIEMLQNVLRDIRHLSRTIHPENLTKQPLTDILSEEVERINRLQFMNANLNAQGREFLINPKHKTILYRIVQEFIANTIRHAKATELVLSLLFKSNMLVIKAKDNGIGFSPHKQTKGIGIDNIHKRAEFIGANCKLISKQGQGTELILSYKNKL